MKKSERFSVDPWNVRGNVNYQRLIKDFGIEAFKELPKIFEEEVLFRRKVVFAHRDFQKVLLAIKNKKDFVMMTGLMPTGKFHIGHMILARQFSFYQKLGAKIYITIADIEAYNARGQSFEESKKIAKDYLLNYAALGLDLKECDIYFQSQRSSDAKKSNAYYRLASTFSSYATLNEFRAVYGNISPAKMNAALVQASDMYHPQLPEFEGKPTITFIPVGVDQDPHIRLARGMANRNKTYKFIPIASTYHLFMPGLKGGKMSASDETSYIAMTDSPREVERKIKRYAFSGGKNTIEEHRKKGGNPDIDVSFQYLKMFFEPDDKKLKQIYNDYKSGKMLTSELKKTAIEKINLFLKEHQKKMKKAEKKVDKFLKSY